MPSRIVAFSFIVSILQSSSVAQDTGGPATPSVAVQRAFGAVELSNLVRAKIDNKAGKLRLIVLLESFRDGKGDAMVPEIRKEKRTRTVIEDGKPVEQEFAVHVVVMNEIHNADISIPAGIKPHTFDASKFDFFDLDGKPIKAGDAAKRLQKLTPVFLLDGFSASVIPLTKVTQEALSPDCLIIRSAEPIRKRRKNRFLPVRPIR